MKTIQFKTVIVLGAAAWSGVSARAAIESYTIDYGSESSPLSGGTYGLSYNEFDPSLGQLTGVSIIINASDGAQSIVYSPTGAGAPYLNASVADGAESVSALGFSVATTSLSAGPFSGITTGFLNPVGSATTQLSGTFQATDPSSFIGVGTQMFTLSVVPGAGMFSGSGTGSQLFFGGAFNSYGTIEIDYSYLPNIVAVPEARHFSLVTAGFAGLVGLGGMIRRGRSSIV